MKKLILALCLFSVRVGLHAQQKEGRVIYERTMQMQFRMPGMNDNVDRTRTDKFELLFGNDQSLWKRVEENDDVQDMTGPGEGVRIRMMDGGSDDVTFHNFNEQKIIESHELFDRTFIVEDSIRKLSWKISDETKTILGYECKKATATQLGQRMTMEVINGQAERKQVPDTSRIVAWYTSAIPVAAGPQFQGQLPGLILELNINNGRIEYKALEISAKADVASIKAPKGKKKLTPAEFDKERDKLMEEMRNNGGGRTMIYRN
jgi:GLPGLI family protein